MIIRKCNEWKEEVFMLRGNSEFQHFYDEYMGVKNGKNIDGILMCESQYRDKPLNKHYVYKIIATNYNGKKLVSYTSEFSSDEMHAICCNLDMNEIENVIPQKNLGISNSEQSYMYRMLQKEHIQNALSTEPLLIEGEQVEFIYLEEYKKFIAVTKEKLLGYCKISDIICGFGNIVVWVEEKYRRLGLAERLLTRLLLQCYKEKIVPMYIVKSDNEASVRLANKMGFEIVQIEFVISQYI